jgi:DHA2 family metal-tetracycline-proton antiporter-like MFS transporter
VAAVLVFVTQILWWLLPVGAVFLAWFVFHIRRAESPFIRPSLFLNKRYTMGLVMIFLSMGTIFGMLFMTPIMLREVNGLGTFAIGLVFFPGAMGAAVLGPPGGKLADRVGSARVVYLGLGILAAGFVILSFMSGAGQWVVATGLIVCYAAFSLLQASTAGAVAESLPREEKGVGMGLYNLIFFMSGAFGAALIGKLLDISGDWPAINPLIANKDAAAYSNLFLLFTVSVVISTMFFHSAYKK